MGALKALKSQDDGRVTQAQIIESVSKHLRDVLRDAAYGLDLQFGKSTYFPGTAAAETLDASDFKETALLLTTLYGRAAGYTTPEISAMKNEALKTVLKERGLFPDMS